MSEMGMVRKREKIMRTWTEAPHGMPGLAGQDDINNEVMIP